MTNTEMNLSKCGYCNGLGYIWENLNEFPHKCSCFNQYIETQKNNKVKELFSEAYAGYTFENFKIETDYQKTMKTRAMNFIATKGINSILILGQSGSGKTHLSVAIAKEFLNKGAWIELMPYAESIKQIKQDVIDKSSYSNTMYKYKNCNYLIIDDFLKGTVKGKAINEKDFSYIYEIIDYRYKYKKPLIITSEFYIDEIEELDEAIAGRLKEMATQYGNNYVIQVSKGKDRNYRMRGMDKI